MSFHSEVIERAVGRRAARTAILRDSKAYQRLYDRLQSSMTRAWSDAMREGVSASLYRLRDLGPGAFTKEDGQMILRQLEASVGVDAISAAMRGPVLNLSDALYRAGAEEVGKAAGVEIAFGRPDLDALDILKTGNLYWVGDSWNTHTQDLLASALDDYFTEGMTRDGLTDRFADDFAGLTEKGQRYWEMLADHTATKTREMGRVTGYDRAGIKQVQVRARIDKATSDICRSMNGRIITVEAMRTQRDAYLDAVSRRNDADAKEAWTMHGQSSGDALKDRPTKGLPRGTAGPPYHFRCRTITVMYLGDAETDLGRWTRAAQDREPLSRKDVAALVDQAKSARWPHIKVVRGHYRKHQKKIGVDSQADYNQSAVDLIRRGDRDVYISMRAGVLNATFVRAAERQDRALNASGYLITSVDLAANKITSHHWRKDIKSTADEVPGKKQNGRGITKWLSR